MTKKQFALIVALWAVVMGLIFCVPAKSAEVGLIQAQGVTCEDSIKDLAATTIRIEQLKKMIDGTTNKHALLVLRTEVQPLFQLHKMIRMWREENCRDS